MAADIAGDVADEVRDQLEALERAGWDSLCAGTGGEFYTGLMTEDGVMVLANGAVLRREEVEESLRDAPPWSSYDLETVGYVHLGDGAAVLVYRGTARREEGPEFVALMTSAYLRQDGAWRLAAYTQTPVP